MWKSSQIICTIMAESDAHLESFTSALNFTDSASDIWKTSLFFFFKLMCQVSEKELLFHSFIFCLLVFSFSHKNKLFLSVVGGKYICYIVNAYFLNGIFFLFRRFQTISRLSMPNLTCETFRGRFQRCKMRSWVLV